MCADRAAAIRRPSLADIHPTLNRLNALGLEGMAKAFVDLEATGEPASFGHTAWLGLLLEREAWLRHDEGLVPVPARPRPPARRSVIQSDGHNIRPKCARRKGRMKTVHF